jgi:hypothetical protein
MSKPLFELVYSERLRYFSEEYWRHDSGEREQGDSGDRERDRGRGPDKANRGIRNGLSGDRKR